MAKAAQKIRSSTQKFTGIQNIKENIAILDDGSACLIIEVQATNFALLSSEEQAAKIASYANFLNSLSFPIQILIRNKKINIASYVKLLEAELTKTQNEKVAAYISSYKAFVQELIKINTVLEKTFYIVFSYSSLEKGAKGVLQKGDFFVQAKSSLATKADSVMSQLLRLSLRGKILEQEDMIRLFYDIYNQSIGDSLPIQDTYGSPIVKAEKI